MNLPATKSVLRCLPRVFTNKEGTPTRLEFLAVDGQPQLLAMYLAYQPRNSFQGLPPIRDDVCARWVDDMVRTGLHVVARSAEETVIGHGAIFPINKRKCEMLVAVFPTFHNLGIGTELVRTCIDMAAEFGLERIWLPVDATNLRARHVYEKCGFEYVSTHRGREVDMTCDALRHGRRAPQPPSMPHGTPRLVVPPILGHADASQTYVS
jgi:RimJ/RimL family protein N-acetyltransferase